MDGEHEVNEVFFDNVEVPAENLRRRGGQGLDLRQVPARPRAHRHRRRRRSKRELARLKEIARRAARDDGKPLIEDPRFRDQRDARSRSTSWRWR